jgi:hypothetical protein
MPLQTQPTDVQTLHTRCFLFSRKHETVTMTIYDLNCIAIFQLYHGTLKWIF